MSFLTFGVQLTQLEDRNMHGSSTESNKYMSNRLRDTALVAR